MRRKAGTFTYKEASYMHEKPSNFNDYNRINDKSVERLSLPDYAREILLYEGVYHDRGDDGEIIDYTWYDELTGDSMRLLSHGLIEPSIYTLEVNDGTHITDNRRKYRFEKDYGVIGVFSAEGEELIDEGFKRQQVYDYVLDRLDTSGVRQPELSAQGKDEFWHAVGRLAIQNDQVDYMVGRVLRYKNDIDIIHKQYDSVIEQASDSGIYYSVSKHYVINAFREKIEGIENSLRSRQLEAPKRFPEIEQ